MLGFTNTFKLSSGLEAKNISIQQSVWIIHPSTAENEKGPIHLVIWFFWLVLPAFSGLVSLDLSVTLLTTMTHVGAGSKDIKILLSTHFNLLYCNLCGHPQKPTYPLKRPAISIQEDRLPTTIYSGDICSFSEHLQEAAFNTGGRAAFLQKAPKTKRAQFGHPDEEKSCKTWILGCFVGATYFKKLNQKKWKNQRGPQNFQSSLPSVFFVHFNKFIQSAPFDCRS